VHCVAVREVLRNPFCRVASLVFMDLLANLATILIFLKYKH